MRRASGFWGARHRLLRTVKETLLRSGNFAYRDRRVRKREFRKLWIQRINAAARMNDLTYSRLIYGMKKADIQIDRKALSELAFHDPAAFTAVADKARAALA
jgi:large subunit ribosomal protein L20